METVTPEGCSRGKGEGPYDSGPAAVAGTPLLGRALGGVLRVRRWPSAVFPVH